MAWSKTTETHNEMVVAAIEPRAKQIAICGHLDPQVFLKVVVS